MGLSTRTGLEGRKGPFGGWTQLSLRTASKARHSWREASGTGPSANLPFGHLGRRGAPCTHCLSVLQRDSSWRRIQPEVRTEPSEEKGWAELASLAHGVNPGPYWLNKCKASAAWHQGRTTLLGETGPWEEGDGFSQTASGRGGSVFPHRLLTFEVRLHLGVSHAESGHRTPKIKMKMAMPRKQLEAGDLGSRPGTQNT